jgi:hypothetical protein
MSRSVSSSLAFTQRVVPYRVVSGDSTKPLRAHEEEAQNHVIMRSVAAKAHG